MKRVPFTQIDGDPYREWWHRRFAPDRPIFYGMRFYQRGRSNIWVGTAEVRGLERTRLDAVGLHLLRIGRRMWKPTSTALVAFGGSAQANFIELTGDEMLAFLAGESLDLTAGDRRRDELSRGFVVPRYGGVALGCGEWHPRGELVSLIPRSQRVSDIEV